MKITGFDIEHFGIWTDLSLPRLQGGLNVFYGENESGKSTLMEFLRAQFYGFGDERRRFARKLSAQPSDWNQEIDQEGQSLLVASGGSIDLDCPSGQYRLRRTFVPDKSHGKELVALTSADGAKQGSQLLRVLLSGVDEATFNNVFAIGLDELQRLSSLDDTEAAAMLFRLSVGMERIAIVEALRDLTAKRNRILDAAEQESKPSQLTQLIQQRAKVAEKLGAVKLQIREYVQLQNEHRAVNRNITFFEEDMAKGEHEKRVYEIAKQIEPSWHKRDQLRRELDAMGSVPVISEEVMNQLQRRGQKIAEHRATFSQLKSEYLKTKQAIQSLPVKETLRREAPRLEILLEEETRLVEMDKSITAIQSEIATIEARIVEEESLIKQGRRTLPVLLPGNGLPGQKSDELHYRDENAEQTNTISNQPSHAVFHSSGPILSLSSTSPTAAVTTKGFRHHVALNDILSAEILEDYRVPARAVAKSYQKLRNAKEQQKTLSRQLKEQNEKTQSELSPLRAEPVSETIQKMGETVVLLQRRESIAKTLAERTGRHREWHRINVALLKNQSLPPVALAGFTVLVLLGAIPIGLEIFKALGIPSFDLSPLFSVLGVFVIVGVLAAKWMIEKTNAKKLHENQHRLGVLSEQIDHAKQDLHATENLLPLSQKTALGQTWETRLQTAQQELAQLQKMAPVDAKKRELAAKLERESQRVLRYKKRFHRAKTRWTEWLRTASLPVEWTPSQIRGLMKHYDVVGDLKRELDYRYELLNQRIRDMRNITERIDRVAAAASLSFDDGKSYVDILHEIRAKLSENEEIFQKREKLRHRLHDFTKMRRKVTSDLSLARREQRDLLSRFSAKTPDALQKLYELHLTRRKKIQQEQSIDREITAAIGGFCAENVFADLLNPRFLQEQNTELTTEEDGNHGDVQMEEALPSLDMLLQSIQNRIDKTSEKRQAEWERRGKITEKMDELSQHDIAAQVQRELAIIDTKIENAKKAWQTYAVSGRMLDVIRSTYEKERQPQTLAEASEILHKLTDGKYKRIWTPLGEETLLIDDDQGHTYDASWLSRGTREMLFIALRLSLASAFAQAGSVLPLVLDDVLVNFDAKKSQAAARVLAELAQAGRQIFLFTCHKHVCRIFQNLDIAVRVLPPVDRPRERLRVFLPLSVLKKKRRAKAVRAKKLAAENERLRIEQEIGRREESIRLEAVQKAEVQRLILQMQQQATAEKTIAADQEKMAALAGQAKK